MLYISMMNARQENQPLHFICIIDEWFLAELERRENCDYRGPAHLGNSKSSAGQFKPAQVSALSLVYSGGLQLLFKAMNGGNLIRKES